MTKQTLLGGVARYNIFASPVGPQIFLAPNEDGTPTAEETAAAEAAAAKEAAEKEAAEKAAKETKDKEKSEKRGLSDTEAKLLKEAMATKDELKKAREALKTFDGVDPEQFKTLKAAKEAADLKEAEAKGEFDRVKAMMAEAHKKEADDLKKQIEDLKKTAGGAAQTIEELTVGQAFLSSEFVRGKLHLPATKARSLYSPHFDIEDGVLVAYNKPRGAPARTKLVDSAGSNLSFDAAMAAIIDADPEKETLLKSTIANGTDSGSKGGKKTEEKSDLTGVAAIAAALKKRKANS